MNRKSFKVEKLSDSSLENVSGRESGLEMYVFWGSMFFVPIAAIGGTACAIASAVYNSKAARQKDVEQDKKYTKKSKDLSIASACFGSLSALCTTTVVTIILTD